MEVLYWSVNILGKIKHFATLVFKHSCRVWVRKVRCVTYADWFVICWKQTVTSAWAGCMYTHIVGHYVLNRNRSKCKYEKKPLVVWHHSLLLMNSFNKTEAAVFSCRLCFLRAFPFISFLNIRSNVHFNLKSYVIFKLKML